MNKKTTPLEMVLALTNNEWDKIIGNFELPLSPSLAEREKKVELLRNSIDSYTGYPVYYFIVDIRKKAIVETHGIAECLGYREPMTLLKYFNIIHPNHLEIYARLAHTAVNMLRDEDFKIGKRVLDSLYIINKAVKHIDGSYKMVTQTTSVHAMDKNNNVVSYLNHYRVVANYSGQPVSLKGVYRRKEHFENLVEITKQKAGYYTDYLPFTNKQMELIKYVVNKERKQTAKEVAIFFNITAPTVYTHYKAIKKRASQFFDIEFYSVEQVYDYLKKENVII